jgi:hypothetical protein
MIEYIHMNPVRDGLCVRASDWRWSSAAFYQTRTPGPLALNLEKIPGDPR